MIEKVGSKGKVPVMGCVSHVIERMEDAAFRYEFGPTTSPEEAFARRVKEWFNADNEKECVDVI